MENALDHELLKHLVRDASENMVEECKRILATNLDEYMRFKELRSLMDEEKHEKHRDIRVEWKQYIQGNQNKFNELMEKYVDRYKENARKNGMTGTVMELNSYLSGHNKWYRMLQEQGRGKKYRDDIRKCCFLFRLSYSETVEFLWSAAQPFDDLSIRDFIIAQAIVEGVYDMDAVDARLLEQHQMPLFTC